MTRPLRNEENECCSEGATQSAAREHPVDRDSAAHRQIETTRREQRREQGSAAKRQPRRPLTERELAIITAVSEHRLLTGDHLRRLFFPTTESRVGAVRRTQRAGKRLVDEGVLDRLDRRVGGERSGSAGHIYVLGPSGQRLLQVGRRPRRATTLGAAFVDHAVAVADVVVGIVEADRDGDLELLELEAEPKCWRSFVGAGAVKVTLKPDLLLGLGLGDYEHRWFVEVDRATESLTRVETKCRSYLAYLHSGEEQRRDRPFPKVLWTVPNQRRANQLREMFVGLPPPSSELFDVCLHDQAIAHLKGGDHDQPNQDH